ncbi:MAG: hypothetical protein JWN62_846 [Acidimicrobiales bacterium]|nr:hypothetical protein [Acidimicrobiales bacterium]
MKLLSTDPDAFTGRRAVNPTGLGGRGRVSSRGDSGSVPAAAAVVRLESRHVEIHEGARGDGPSGRLGFPHVEIHEGAGTTGGRGGLGLVSGASRRRRVDGRSRRHGFRHVEIHESAPLPQSVDRSFITWRFTKAPDGRRPRRLGFHHVEIHEGAPLPRNRRANDVSPFLDTAEARRCRSATPLVYTRGMVDDDNSIDASGASTRRGPLTDTPVPTPDTRLPRAGWRDCSWCRQPFEIVPRPGRPQLYCSPSCRQRAHEARKGLGAGAPGVVVIHAGTSLAPPPTIRTRFQAGRVGFGRGKMHALRWVEPVDSSTRRATLCGLLAWSVPLGFSADGDDACRTCVGAMQANSNSTSTGNGSGATDLSAARR